jgi:hypothetical protein
MAIGAPAPQSLNVTAMSRLKPAGHDPYVAEIHPVSVRWPHCHGFSHGEAMSPQHWRLSEAASSEPLAVVYEMTERRRLQGFDAG